MIDKWFKKDLDAISEKHQIVVFVDESNIAELHVKYLIEKNRAKSDKYLIYTQRAKDDLKFVREYCETNGAIEIKYLQNYIKEKLHKTLNLNLNMSNDVPFYSNNQMLMQKSILME